MARLPPKPVKPPKDASYPGITETRPILFWRTCHICKDRIREEDMWRYSEPISIHMHLPDLLTAKYACKICCPTRQEFYERLFPARGFGRQSTYPPRLPRRPRPARLTPPAIEEKKEEEPLQPPTERSRFKGLIEE